MRSHNDSIDTTHTPPPLSFYNTFKKFLQYKQCDFWLTAATNYHFWPVRFGTVRTEKVMLNVSYKYEWKKMIYLFQSVCILDPAF